MVSAGATLPPVPIVICNSSVNALNCFAIHTGSRAAGNPNKLIIMEKGPLIFMLILKALMSVCILLIGFAPFRFIPLRLFAEEPGVNSVFGHQLLM